MREKKKREKQDGPCPETIKTRARRAAALPRIVQTGVGLFRQGDLACALGITRQTVYAWQRAGLIPPPVTVGTIRGWSGEVVRALLSGQGRG